MLSGAISSNPSRTGVVASGRCGPRRRCLRHECRRGSQIALICSNHDVPLVAFGTGTSAEDHVAAVFDGVLIDMSGLDRILAIRPDDFLAVVQPGVTRKTLNDAFRDTGLLFLADPGADASIGGMTATRASGANAVRYGTMRDNVLSLETVSWDGRVFWTGSLAPKSSAGYDLTAMMVGLEGTLGIITKITVKLHAIPEASSALACSFPSLGNAVDASIMLRKLRVPVAHVEFMDVLQMKACNTYSGADFAESPYLLLELRGSETALVEQGGIVRDVFRDVGGMGIRVAEATEEKSRIWVMRHEAYYAACALTPGYKAQPTDACGPMSRLAACIEETIADFETNAVVAPIRGHVGAGNFHTLLLYDPRGADETAGVREASTRLIERAIQMEGTCAPGNMGSAGASWPTWNLNKGKASGS